MKTYSYLDPFCTDRHTRLIHLNDDYPAIETAALLSRYSRSTKSMLELIETEFQDKNRAPTFIHKLLSQFGDDSIAELASQTVGIEGLSILAASKLTDARIGISFLEKSTRYVPFDPNAFYIPGAVYQAGLVDEFKDLCGLSYTTFNYLFKELCEIFTEKYSINTCRFLNTLKNTDVSFEHLTLESDIQSAKRAYTRAIKDKAFDIAGYAWLTSLKTNIGFNSNIRALEGLLVNTRQSRLPELKILSNNLFPLLAESIGPFLSRVSAYSTLAKNPLDTYNSDNPSVVSVYKNNIMNLIKPEEKFHNSLNEPGIAKKRNTELIKNLLSELGITTARGDKVKFRGSDINAVSIDASDFEPWINLTNHSDEKSAMDTLCSTILYEHNENLLEYDNRNINNIDDNIRIQPIDTRRIKAGILYNMLNASKNMMEEPEDTTVAKTSENTISFNDIMDYWYFSTIDVDDPTYQNPDNDKEFCLPKDQEYLIRKYVGERSSRRDKLGRAFEFIDYTFELSSSFRIMREFKRHRLMSSIYPTVLTARNSYDSFIFPKYIVTNKGLFDSYKNLLDKSFDMYNKLADKCGYITAQYALPLATRCNYLTKINARELDYIVALRTTPQAHEEFRAIAQGMYTLVKTVHPSIAKLFVFTDLNEYNLGRLTAENKHEVKINKMVDG